MASELYEAGYMRLQLEHKKFMSVIRASEHGTLARIRQILEESAAHAAGYLSDPEPI